MFFRVCRGNGALSAAVMIRSVLIQQWTKRPQGKHSRWLWRHIYHTTSVGHVTKVVFHIPVLEKMVDTPYSKPKSIKPNLSVVSISPFVANTVRVSHFLE